MKKEPSAPPVATEGRRELILMGAWTQRICLGVAEEAGDEDFDEEEAERDAERQRDIGLGKHVAEAGSSTTRKRTRCHEEEAGKFKATMIVMR